MLHKEWRAEAIRRFGTDEMDWRFKCPSCGYVASIRDWKAAGATIYQAAFSCIGRYTGSEKELGDRTGGPCNYSGGGLIGLNPVTIELPEGKTARVFDFEGV